MPQSDHWAVPWVIDLVGAISPSSVLDFGVGNGQYGLQVRQAIDISRGRLVPSSWKLSLDGLEVFEEYRNPIWSYFYNNVFVTDGVQFLRERLHQRYDVILVCDVIEHFSQSEALNLLDLLQSRADTVIITTPNGSFPQGAVFGNEAECHLSEWIPSDFERLGAATHPIARTFLAVFSRDNGVLKRVRGAPSLFNCSGRQLLKLTARWFPRMLASRFGFKGS